MDKIIMFHGASCPHCHKMMPIVDKLIDEGFKVEKLEVWNNPNNAKKMRGLKDLIIPACGDGLGVPAFVNIKKKTATCGEQSLEELKVWMSK
jgi:thiol-disulfide isomerase/thioredoxin